jgi:hypothetical protein
MSEFPPNYIVNKPYFQSGEDGCQAQPYAYWTCNVKAPDGSVISGFGTNSDQAMTDCKDKCWRQYNFYKLSDKERLKTYLANAKERGRFYDKELLDVIDILSGRLAE